MLANINNTIKASENIYLETLKQSGVKGIVIILFVLFVIWMFWYILTKSLDFFIHYKENKRKKDSENKKIELQEQMLEQIEKDNEMLLENGTVLRMVAEKMNISVSKRKYKILSRTFIGIDRAYLVKVKQKLFDFFESDQDKKERFLYLYEEVVPLYYETVLSKLHDFIFHDYKEYEALREKSRKEIIKFLNEIKKIIDEDGKVEEYINTELIKLGDILVDYLTDYYSKIINEKYDINYIGE
jgi:hypothetical protein